MLGDFLLSTGDLDKATRGVSIGQRGPSKDAQAKKKHIQLLILKNRLDEATRLNDEVLKANSKDPEGLVYRGQIQLKRGQPRDAAATFETVLSTDPTTPWPTTHGRRLPGARQSHVRRKPVAERCSPEPRSISKLIMRSPRSNSRTTTTPLWSPRPTKSFRLQPLLPDGYVLLGLSWQGRKDEKQAEAHNAAAMKSPAEVRLDIFTLEIFRLEQKKVCRRQKTLRTGADERSHRSRRSGWDRPRGLGQNKWEKPSRGFQAQIAKVPNHGNFYYLLGVVLSDKKTMPVPKRRSRNPSNSTKTNSDALLKLGQVQIAAGNTDQAISTYQQSIQSNPTDARFYVSAGEMHESSRQFPQAKQIVSESLQVQPDNALAKNNLAYRMLEEAARRYALAMAQQARRGMPDSPTPPNAGLGLL